LTETDFLPTNHSHRFKFDPSKIIQTNSSSQIIQSGRVEIIQVNFFFLGRNDREGKEDIIVCPRLPSAKIWGKIYTYGRGDFSFLIYSLPTF
jgi:hypothetical protein